MSPGQICGGGNIARVEFPLGMDPKSHACLSQVSLNVVFPLSSRHSPAERREQRGADKNVDTLISVACAQALRAFLALGVVFQTTMQQAALTYRWQLLG